MPNTKEKSEDNDIKILNICYSTTYLKLYLYQISLILNVCKCKNLLHNE